MNSFSHAQSLKTIFLCFIGLSLIIRLLGISFTDLLPEEAYYWNYAEHLDFGYLDHPPMVALLIKVSTSLLGTNEVGVRLFSILCWLITTFFSYRLTNLIKPGAGIYSVFLLSTLPYFFIESLVMTPDEPLLACSAATLYFLYRAIILNQNPCWYWAGLSFGLGMLSKYPIGILGFSTLLYLIMTPKSRHMLAQKEPYFAALISFALFTPVIYWNATHQWISFVFQSAHRLDGTPTFSLHHLLGLLILFLLPPGLLGLWSLIKSTDESKRFLKFFTLIPLFIFGIFSLKYDIKFNWIGPGLLALIPWLSMLIHDQWNYGRAWLVTGACLICVYAFILWVILFGTPLIAYKPFFIKFISWENLTHQIQEVAKNEIKKTHTMPIIIPLDHYFMNSELAFYQAKMAEKYPKTGRFIFPIVARHVLGKNSLMFEYWSHDVSIAGKNVIFITIQPKDFNSDALKSIISTSGKTQKIISQSQGHGTPSSIFYYQVAKTTI